MLEAVEAALSAGDQAGVDKLIAAWKRGTRRARDLQSLRAAAAAESEATPVRHPDEISNEDLADELERLTGRRFTILDEDG